MVGETVSRDAGCIVHLQSLRQCVWISDDINNVIRAQTLGGARLTFDRKRGMMLALTAVASPAAPPQFGEEGAMDIALASLVAGSLFGLPDRPLDLSPSMAGTSLSLHQPIVDDLVARAEPRRPAILPVLYGAYAAFQGLDVWTTTRGIAAGARETNPAVGRFAGSVLGLATMKVATTTATIYFADRLWRRNRIGAIVLMTAVNGVSAWVVIHNTKVAQRAEVGR